MEQFENDDNVDEDNANDVDIDEDGDDDVKGGRDWWSEMPGADRFPPILDHLLSIGWDRDDHIDADPDRECDKADDHHIGGHHQS